jgi:hypothetical protein
LRAGARRISIRRLGFLPFWILKEAVMAKGQMRVPKEKKKPKADKDKPKHMSAYKLSQTSGSSTLGSSSSGGKK